MSLLEFTLFILYYNNKKKCYLTSECTQVDQQIYDDRNSAILIFQTIEFVFHQWHVQQFYDIFVS